MSARRTLPWLAAVLLAAATAARAQNPIDFALQDIDGRTVRLSDHLGKSVIVVDFWATWCVPCVKELAHFQRFHDLYKDQGLLILAITVDGPESVSMVRPFVNRYKYTFPILLDTDSRVIALYNPRVVMPYTVIIGRDGKIRTVHQGYSLGDEKRLEAEIQEALKPEAAAAAGGIALNVTEAFLFRNFSDADYTKTYRGGRHNQIINQLEVSAAWKSFLAGARWDENWDFSPWSDKFRRADRWRIVKDLKYPEEKFQEYRPLIFRKSFIEYGGGGFSLRAGDFYHTVGRGLAFSLLKTFEKEGLEYIIDTTVDGGKMSFETGRLSLDAFGGYVARGEDELVDNRIVRDRVYGGAIGYKIPGLGDVRLNVVGAEVEPGTLINTRHVLMESLALNIPNWKDRLKFYGEFLLLRKKKHFTETTYEGHGLYLESVLFLDRLTLLLEFKDYRHLDFEYGRPPLLETEQLPIVANQFVDSAEDVTGVSGRVDYNFPKAQLLLFGKITYQDDKRGNVPRDIFHGFAGIEKKFKETGWLTLIAGVRDEAAKSLVFWDTAGTTWHGQGNVSYPLSPRLSLEADLEAKTFRGDLAFGGKYYVYDEIRSYISLHVSPRWVFTVLYDFTEDPKIMTFKPQHDWWGAQVEFRYAGANAVRVFYGQNKGGVKCAGGICRFFPPFEGLRVDCFIRF